MYWGTSEWDADEIVQALEIAEKHHLHKPITEQPQYNLLNRRRFEKEYGRVFKDYGYGSTTFSPLASGILSGKYLNGIPRDSRATLEGYDWVKENAIQQTEKVRALEPIAKELGCTLSQLSIAWILKNPNVSSIITGATRVEQLQENLKAIDVAPKITSEVMQRIDKAIGWNDEEEEE